MKIQMININDIKNMLKTDSLLDIEETPTSIVANYEQFIYSTTFEQLNKYNIKYFVAITNVNELRLVIGKNQIS